ncbi:DUF6053 domain-containing protein [Lysobacter yananisis]|uniref:DUF6053 domain-containing protein n=1 Tax=Lysobacter yananisis TaxID=1003114 RepID=UPI003CE44EED
MGGTSVPTLSFPVAAIGHKSVGPEGPPTTARRSGLVALADSWPTRGRLGFDAWLGLCGRNFSPGAFLSGRSDRAQERRA